MKTQVIGEMTVQRECVLGPYTEWSYILEVIELWSV
jgi:hypothetical protein